MTPLEIAAKGWWEAESLRGLPWEQVSEDVQERTMRRMRAALMALAEADLPEDVSQAGANAVNRHNQYGGQDDRADARVCFAAMLRAIAGEGR
jgi:hypothetical protein